MTVYSRNLKHGDQMKKFLKWTGIAFGGLIGVALLAGIVLYPIGLEKLTRSYPHIAVETVKIPTDPDAVARGKHLAIIWACTRCHGEDLSGKLLSDDPILGTIAASNLTSGQGGIAQTYTAADWIRAIRHGVRPDSRAEIYMYDYYSTLSDQDLGDLLAYLKQLPPVDAVYPAMRLGPIKPIARALGLLIPAAERIDHSAPRPAEPVPGATLEYGTYLSGLCTHCHSRNFGGKLSKWTQADFIRAIQTGVLPNGKRLGSTMSARTFSELNDLELTALWLYVMDAGP